MPAAATSPGLGRGAPPRNADANVENIDAMNQTANHFLGAPRHSWSTATSPARPLIPRPPQTTANTNTARIHTQESAQRNTNQPVVSASRPNGGSVTSPLRLQFQTVPDRARPPPASSTASSSTPNPSSRIAGPSTALPTTITVAQPPITTANGSLGTHNFSRAGLKRPVPNSFDDAATRKPHAPPGRHQLAQQPAPAQMWHGVTPQLCEFLIQEWRRSKVSIDDDTQRRVDALVRASRAGDNFYLMLHQIFCIVTVGGRELPAFVGHILKPELMELIKEVLRLFLGARAPSMEFLSTFRDFPVPMSNSYVYPPETSFVMEFLHTGIGALRNVEHFCRVRGYPPLVVELNETLRVPSKMLSELIFVSILSRMLGAHAGVLLEQGLNIFVHDMKQYEQYVFAGVPPDPTFQKDIARRYVSLINGTKRSGSQVNSLAPRPSVNHNPSPNSQIQNTMMPSTTLPSVVAGNQSLLNRAPTRAIAASQHVQVPSSVQTETLRPLATSNSTDPRLFPRPGSVQAQVHPADPNTYALHQARLRSPKMQLKIPSDSEEQPTQLLQYIAEYCFAPSPLSKVSSIQEATFYVNEVEMACLPTDETTGIRHIGRDSQLYRLRCIKSADQPSLEVWAVSDSHWPLNVYFSCNGNRLEQRRKLHHGRDLPIDITRHIRQGENTIKVISNHGRAEPPELCFYVVERLKMVPMDEARSKCVQDLIPAADAKAELVASLKNDLLALNSGNDDDDLAIVSHSINISIQDPFMSKTFEVPARGKTCRHRDCFDLDVYLQTRMRDPGQPSYPDYWRCPICGADARPVSLIVDGWLLEIKEQLIAMGRSDVKTIVVNSDGVWKIKPEIVNGKADSPNADYEAVDVDD